MMCLSPEHFGLELHILALVIHLTLPTTTALSNTWGYTQLIFLDRRKFLSCNVRNNYVHLGYARPRGKD